MRLLTSFALSKKFIERSIEIDNLREFGTTVMTFVMPFVEFFIMSFVITFVMTFVLTFVLPFVKFFVMSFEITFVMRVFLSIYNDNIGAHCRHHHQSDDYLEHLMY